LKLRRYQVMGQAVLFILIALQLLVLIPTVVYAAPSSTSIEDQPFPVDKVEQSEKDNQGSASLGWTAFKLVLSLIVIIMLDYFIIRVFVKKVNRRFQCLLL